MADENLDNLDAPFWKHLRLSLERPYKDDLGNRIPILYDLTPQGERIYEPCVHYLCNCWLSDFCRSKEPPSARLASNLTKIFAERGFNIFEKRDDPSRADEGPDTLTDYDDMVDEKDAAQKPMTVDELCAMRMEIMPHLLLVYFSASLGLSQDLS